LTSLLVELLDLTNAGPPSAAQLDEHLRGRATSRTIAGPNLAMPAWAHEVGGAADVYLALDGDLAGVHVHEDPRGWGAYATLSVRQGSLADVESVVGPTDWMARNPDDFTSGERVAAYVERSGWTVRVFTELGPDRRAVRFITLSYPSRDAKPRSPDEPRLVVIHRPLPPAPPDLGRPPLPPPPPMRAAASLQASAPPDAATNADTCARCGADTRDAGSFCGTCGLFLEWSR
jgi:hypothetical protein